MTTTAELVSVALRHHQAGELDQARELYERVLEADPRHAQARHLLGVIAHQAGRHDAAIAHIEQAIALDAGNAGFHNNLGLAYQAAGNPQAAVASLSRAVRLQPAYAPAHNNLGISLRELGRLEEAVACYRLALRLQPDFAKALNNLGNALRELDRLDEAAACLQQAIRLAPGYAEAHYNLGLLLADQGQVQAALACQEEAIRLDPDYANAHYNRALCWLTLGDFTAGWPEYEWRSRCKRFPVSTGPAPPWDGADLAGKTILLHAEQGLGDSLHFIRYAGLVKRPDATVLLECPDALTLLLARCKGIDRTVQSGELRTCDYRVPLPSLPGLFATIPASIPYLFNDSGIVGRWRRELSTMPGLRVGIVWQGEPGNPRDRHRSVPLGRLGPLADLRGVRLFSLQKGPGAEQRSAVGFPIVDLGSRFDTFADTAAAVVNLDLVVTVDTAVAHLAGALGVPVWVALPNAADWRWQLEREDSVWYPSMRLFRQSRRGDWEAVFGRMAAELARMAPEYTPRSA
jgi:Flp pilus assembly protein TadD